MGPHRLAVLIALVGVIIVGQANGSAPTKVDQRGRDEMVSRLDAAIAPLENDSLSVPYTGAISNYVVDWNSLNGGGGINAASPNNKLGASLGQSAAGVAQSTNYQVGIGFWYGAGCSCDCHGDPNCDGIVSDVVDVVATVNVAFRAAAPLLDGDGACPRERTDVGGGPAQGDCDGVTNVVDVVKVVDVAFRGADPGISFCRPCW